LEIRNVAVFGAGQMGAGIAQVLAQHDHSVTLVDVEPRLIDAGMKAITAGLAKGVEKGKLTPDVMESALRRIRATTRPPEVVGCQLVIEAIVEDLKVKRNLFHELDAMLPPEVIFATNTSSISITALASATKREDRFVGLHFFNPVPAMRLVEVIRGEKTSEETLTVAMDLARSLGKTPVTVLDRPGFVSNRLLMPYLNEAVKTLSEGIASKEDIDTVVRLGYNIPMGPFELADLIGLDTVVNAMEVLHEGFKDPRFEPAPLLRNMVAAGNLGRKSGRGFYEYSKR